MKKITVIFSLLMFLFSCSGVTKKEEIKSKFGDIYNLVKEEYAPDRRSATFEALLDFSDNSDDIVLRGSTTAAEAKESLVTKLTESGINVKDSMVILPHPALGEKIYGVTNQSVINLRYGSSYTSDFATQAIMGTPLAVLEKRSGWTRVMTPEGYIAWVSSGSVAYKTEGQFNDWVEADKVIVTSYYAIFHSAPSDRSDVVSDGVMGNIVKLKGVVSSFYKVELPDGREAYLHTSNATSFSKWLATRDPSAQNIIATAKRFVGFPYLWGGTSIKAMDCSGFTKTVFLLNGVIINRDASQQAKTGEDVELTPGFENLQPADLLFFGSKATEERPERITHVAIYLSDGVFIHAATSVRINSLIPEAENYYEGSNTLVRARRIINMIDNDPGIVSVSKHKGYIKQ